MRNLTDRMILSYAISEARDQFKRDRLLKFKLGKIINTDTKEMITPCSILEIKDIGWFEYHLIDDEFYYEGRYPGDIFFGLASIRLKTNFKSTLLPGIAGVFREVCHLKTTKIIEYSEDIERELFAL